nr:ATP-dependent DNA helicase RecG [Pectinatus frisingensis]
MMIMDLKQNIQYLKGIGPQKSKALKKIGIENIYDLLTYYPKRYSDQSELTPISMVNAGTLVNITGRLLNIQEKVSRRGMKITTALLADDSATIQIIWFNQPFIKKTLKIGSNIFIRGKADYAYGGYGHMTINQVASYSVLENNEVECKFLPLYTLPETIKPKFFRQIISTVLTDLQKVPCALPLSIRTKYKLVDKKTALQYIHQPQNKDEITAARRMLIFEELFIMQCGLIYRRKINSQNRRGIRYLANSNLTNKLYQQLPFKLTIDQQNVWREICHDMESPIPMQRLLQGDVGSGKTVIALLALVKTIENGYQGALMAPTEILAKQHFVNFCRTLTKLDIKVGLLTGSLSSKEHEDALGKIATGEWQIIIGTHALIQDKVIFAKLGFVVTDEQHRFGIEQRARLETKASYTPDVLVMTATPIPRTMTLTVYGDLDISSIKHLPPGRKPIRTFLRTKSARDKIYKFVYQQINAGRQAYVVCPLIETSENVAAVSAEAVYEELTHTVFKNTSCALLHGKLNTKNKEQIMNDFFTNKIKLLVSTTVIEVGVNVPNASIMVIEGADRFGLAQLHQLRGRIGRGPYNSYCILLSDNKSDKSKQRLTLMEKVNDGFKLAEADLQLRGPGQFFGTMQHGLPDLKIADVLNDTDILLNARNEAEQWCHTQNNIAAIIETIKLQYKNNFFKIFDT